jgi:hypothetical protein
VIGRAMGERALGMLLRPAATLRAAVTPADPGFTLAFGAVLLAVPQVVLMLLGLFGVGFRNVGADAVLQAGLAGFVAGAAVLAAMAALVRWLAGAMGGACDGARAVAFVVHATVPAWVLGAVGNLAGSRQWIVAVAGIAWSIALLGVGAGPVAAVPRERRLAFAAAAGAGTVLIWAVALVVLAAVLTGVLERELAERVVG